MNKQVSPMFVAIVVIVVLLLGALYFLVQFRESETRAALEKAAFQRQAERMRATRGRGRGEGGMAPAPGAAPTRAPVGREEQGATAEDE